MALRETTPLQETQKPFTADFAHPLRRALESLPNRGLVLIAIGTPLIYLLVGTNPLFSGIPAPVITTLLGAVYMVSHFWSKSTYSPIYDRWIMEHGTDHQKWPGASKSEKPPVVGCSGAG